MNYLDRYRNGEYEQVWNDLQALGPAVRREPHNSQAREVATETMRRVRLPDPSADLLFLYERHGLLFVPYLRLAILHWGGFPGLDGRAVQFEPLGGLVAGLERF